MTVIPDYLQEELRLAEERIKAAEEKYNFVQHRISIWRCSGGFHHYVDFIKPPVGRACMHCREKEPTR